MPEWSRIRKEYPALKDYIYLDTAGTGVMSAATAKTAESFYEDVALHGNVRLEHWLERIEEGRCQVAELIGAHRDEIAFTANTSHGMNIAALMLKRQGEVVVNESEFPTSTVPWLHHGYRVHFVRPGGCVVHLEAPSSKSKGAGNAFSCISEAIGRRKKGIIVHSYVQYATGFRQGMAEAS